MTERRPRRPGPLIPADPEPDPVERDPDPPLPTLLEVVGVLALVVVAALGAVVSVLLTPARIGTTLVPFAVVLALAVNIALPLLGFRLSRSRGIAALPVVVFFVAGWALSIAPGGDVLLAGGSESQIAISYATLLVGVVVGAIAVVRAR